MDIQTLINQFVNLGHAQVGRGPKYPAEPATHLLPEIDSFLDSYSFLKQDKGYVDFLEFYAGASVFWPNGELIIDIFGFTKVSSHLLNLEGPVVDEDGYLMFANTIY